MFTSWYQLGLSPTRQDDWWKGSVFAVDSLNMVAGGFVDYLGNQMIARNNVFGVGGNAPVVATADTGLQYGRGINLPPGAILASSIGALSPLLLTEDFTFDYWYRQTTNALPLGASLLTCYPNLQVATTYTNRFWLAAGIGGTGNATTANLSLWNNAAPPVVIGTTPHGLATTAWQHVAVVYQKSTGTIRIYKGGALLTTMTHTLAAVTGTVQIGLTNDKSTTGCVERVRFRTGALYTGSSFSLSALYP